MLFFIDKPLKLYSSEPKVTSLNCLFGPTKSPKPNNISFTVKYDKEKHEILNFEKMEPVEKNYLNHQN